MCMATSSQCHVTELQSNSTYIYGAGHVETMHIACVNKVLLSI